VAWLVRSTTGRIVRKCKEPRYARLFAQSRLPLSGDQIPVQVLTQLLTTHFHTITTSPLSLLAVRV
jgi:hypothetical protein